MDLDEIRAIDPSEPVTLTIRIFHDEPVEVGPLAELLESLAVVQVLATPEADHAAVYFDEAGERWRLRSGEDGLLQTTPAIIETDAAFLITLATVAAVAGIVAAVATVVGVGMDIARSRRERKRQAKESARRANVNLPEGVVVQIGGDLVINGNGNTINIFVERPAA